MNGFLLLTGLNLSEEESFLYDFTDRPTNSLASNFIKIMRKLILKDQGLMSSIDINEQVYLL